MHYLVAVAPVVKQAGDEALGDLDDVDQPAQHSQRVHGDEEAQGVGAAGAAAEHPEQEEAEAEAGLPEERLQAQDVGSGRGGRVDAVGRQEDVGQQGGLSRGWVAQESDVYDGKCTWWQEGRCTSDKVRTVMENLGKTWNFKMVIFRPGKVMEKI